MTREEKVAVVEAYLQGLASKDISKVPFAADITFEGPRVPSLAGREAVVGFLKMIVPATKDIQIKQHIVEGDYVATVFDMETTDGTDRVFDRTRLLHGEVKEIHSFYYPRQLPTRLATKAAVNTSGDQFSNGLSARSITKISTGASVVRASIRAAPEAL